jgi:beta-glucosidase
MNLTHHQQATRHMATEVEHINRLIYTKDLSVAKAKEIVGSPENRAAGLTAQKRAVTVLSNQVVDGSPALPLTTGIKVYAEGVDPEVLANYATIVESPDSADVAIIRTRAPFEQRGKGFEMLFPSGSLDFSETEIDRINEIAAKVPTVLDVYLDRPAILTPFVDSVAAIIGNFGISSTALLEVLFGNFKPEGKLPFEIPRSMAAVEASREDVPFDTENPVFRFGHGLSI